MYEILKQYEKQKYRIIAIEELKELLGIKKDNYPRWDSLKNCVLDVCQKALEEHTDIKFTYEPHGKLGKGGKILSLKFNISKNQNYSDPLTLDEFIENQGNNNAGPSKNKKDIDTPSSYQERLEFSRYACNEEFTNEESQILYNLVMKRPCKNFSVKRILP
ncbi:MAG: replication initiation protein [Tannerella sp.]|jgi:plasmid replication initiation protein|nr:replication initiation protein [Tannerella sp.]